MLKKGQFPKLMDIPFLIMFTFVGWLCSFAAWLKSNITFFQKYWSHYRKFLSKNKFFLQIDLISKNTTNMKKNKWNVICFSWKMWLSTQIELCYLFCWVNQLVTLKWTHLPLIIYHPTPLYPPQHKCRLTNSKRQADACRRVLGKRCKLL